MSKPDNHIDELDEILHDLAEALESLDEEPDSGKWAENGIEYIDEAKRQIEDFYRNKIPKKVNAEMPNATTVAYNRAIDDITAQFNSGGSDD